MLVVWLGWYLHRGALRTRARPSAGQYCTFDRAATIEQPSESPTPVRISWYTRSLLQHQHWWKNVGLCQSGRGIFVHPPDIAMFLIL